jgi:peptide chain release factor 1
MASCQDERSQLKNRVKAMAVLRARILDADQRQRQEQMSEERRSQVGTGERAEKIRTYNFPQDRATDHRTGQTTHGSLDEIIDALVANERAKSMEQTYHHVVPNA